MSGNNVHAEISRHSESLADKLASNDAVSNVILALLGRLIIMCQQRGTPLEGLALSPLHTTTEGREFIMSTQLTFNRLSLHAPALWQPANDFEAFTASRAQGLALALRKSPALSRLFQAMVEKMEAFAQYKGIPFSALRIRNPFISTDNVVVVGVGKDLS